MKAVAYLTTVVLVVIAIGVGIEAAGPQWGVGTALNSGGFPGVLTVPAKVGEQVDLGTGPFQKRTTTPIVLKSVRLVGATRDVEVISTLAYNEHQTTTFLNSKLGNLARTLPKIFGHPHRVVGRRHPRRGGRGHPHHALEP